MQAADVDDNSVRCAHLYADCGWLGFLYQPLDFEQKCRWFGGTANNNMISLVLCEPSCVRYGADGSIEITNKTKAAVWLTREYRILTQLCAKICDTFNLQPEHELAFVTRETAAKKGLCDNATPAGLEELWKAVGLEYTMDRLRFDARQLMKKK